MSNKENEKLKVNKDIASEYCSPYYRICVYREPKFPLDQYETPLKNQFTKDELLEQYYVQYPCGYCKFKTPKLIWARVSLTNAGGTKEYEFKCEKCGIYTFYEEQEFS
ncbi:MAG: hypothetical protein FK733_16900 [Asgard group archaeon]|nr:hypothetical protein [Asgard group archaeon]